MQADAFPGQTSAVEVAPGPAAPKRGPKRILAQGTLALVVSALALWWAFHDANLDEMMRNLRRSSWWVVVLFGVGQLVIHGFRLLRWGLYIRPLGTHVSKRAIFAAGNLGIAATFIIPLRLGEFVRPMLINRSGVPFGSAVASVVVERIADGLCAVGMFLVFFSFVPPPSSPALADELARLSTASSYAAAIFGGGLVFLVAAAIAREPVLGAARAVLSRISVTLSDRVLGLISTFLDGLAALGSAWRALAFIGLTVAYWFGNGLLLWMLAASYEPDVPVVAGLFSIAVLVFAVMIPAGPAFAGTFEAGIKAGFGAFGLEPSTTIVIAVVAHVVQLLTMGSFVGMGLMAAEPTQRRRRPSSGASPEPPPAA